MKEEKQRRYFAKVVYTGMEGREQHDNEITQDFFGSSFCGPCGK